MCLQRGQANCGCFDQKVRMVVASWESNTMESKNGSQLSDLPLYGELLLVAPIAESVPTSVVCIHPKSSTGEVWLTFTGSVTWCTQVLFDAREIHDWVWSLSNKGHKKYGKRKDFPLHSIRIHSTKGLHLGQVGLVWTFE